MAIPLGHYLTSLTIPSIINAFSSSDPPGARCLILKSVLTCAARRMDISPLPLRLLVRSAVYEDITVVVARDAVISQLRVRATLIDR